MNPKQEYSGKPQQQQQQIEYSVRHAPLVSGNFIIALYKKTGGKNGKKNLVIAKCLMKREGDLKMAARWSKWFATGVSSKEAKSMKKKKKNQWRRDKINKSGFQRGRHIGATE